MWDMSDRAAYVMPGRKWIGGSQEEDEVEARDDQADSKQACKRSEQEAESVNRSVSITQFRVQRFGVVSKA
jgi:hypothetical protein